MSLSGVLLLALCHSVGASVVRNVLLITVDDLRPQLNGAYGMTQVKTPYLDAFAAQALTFQRAYCQMAVCSPSRNSFMTGRRPDTTRIWNFKDSFRTAGPDWTTIPEYFKKHDFLTYGSGKLYHPNSPPKNDFPRSWTEDEYNPYFWGNGAPIGDAGGCAISKNSPSETLKLPLADWGAHEVCSNEGSQALYDHDNKTTPQVDSFVEYDHRVATRAIESMARAKELGKPFFIAAGIRRPHLDWRAPSQFWEQYEGETIDVAKHQTIGENITILAYERNGEMGQTYSFSGSTQHYRESADGPPIPEALQRQLRRGYYAAVSFMDFEVGRMLKALEAFGLDNSTAVLFHADHGWKLGEHGDWSKCTNWELDARVPLIIRAPWIEASLGKRTLALAELVDLYPTLVELAGLPPSQEQLEGTSLVPVLTSPSEDAPHHKTMAFSQYPRCPTHSMFTDSVEWECLYTAKDKIEKMGFSVRVADARYTEWRVWKPNCAADWSPAGLVAQELYDHEADTGLGASAFDDYEYVNLAYKTERKDQVSRLAAALRMQFDHADASCS